MTAFLQTHNPDFDLSTVQPRRKTRQAGTNTGLAVLPLRSLLVTQHPLAPNERLPMTLIIQDGRPAISAIHQENYFHINRIDLFAHPNHAQMYDLIMEELVDQNYRTTHGTSTTLRKGCSGPLCRRSRAFIRFEASHLRKARAGTTKYEGQIFQLRYEQLKRNAPQYAAVEPLMFAMSVYAHILTPPEGSLTSHSRQIANIRRKSVLLDKLRQYYGDDIQTY